MRELVFSRGKSQKTMTWRFFSEHLRGVYWGSWYHNRRFLTVPSFFTVHTKPIRLGWVTREESKFLWNNLHSGIFYSVKQFIQKWWRRFKSLFWRLFNQRGWEWQFHPWGFQDQLQISFSSQNCKEYIFLNSLKCWEKILGNISKKFPQNSSEQAGGCVRTHQLTMNSVSGSGVLQNP